MDSTSSSDEIAFKSPFFRNYKDGRIDRFQGINTDTHTDTVPPSLNPQTGVQSQDAQFSVRLFLPGSSDPARKLPLHVYFHGGAFCIESPFSSIYARHLNTLASVASFAAVSVQDWWALEHSSSGRI